MLFTLQVEGRGLWQEQREQSGGSGGDKGWEKKARGLVDFSYKTHGTRVRLQISLEEVHIHIHHRGQSLKAARRSFRRGGRGSVRLKAF